MSKIRLPDGASRYANVPPPAPVPMMMTSYALAIDLPSLSELGIADHAAFHEAPDPFVEVAASAASAAFRASPMLQRAEPSSTTSLSRNCPGTIDSAGNPPRLPSQPGVVNRKLTVPR